MDGHDSGSMLIVQSGKILCQSLTHECANTARLAENRAQRSGTSTWDYGTPGLTPFKGSRDRFTLKCARGNIVENM